MSARHRKALWLAAGVLLLVGVAWWQWPEASHADAVAPATHADATQRSAVAMFAPIPAPPDSLSEARPVASPAPAASNAAAPPPGVTVAQWAQLRAEMANQPNGHAELRRLTEYFVYADVLQRFRRLHAQGGSLVEQRALAQQLDRGLDDRLQRREVSAADAQRIKAAVLEVTLPDVSQRQHELALWTQAQRARAGTQDADSAQREAQFQRQQSAIVAAWSARPPAERDPKVLEAQLEALRRASFATPGP